jgi:murein DD-endopeptidase MepM/ murein hydrolase activator NlpD
MSLAELIGRLSRPDSSAIAVSRHAALGAVAAFVLLVAWAAASGWYFLFSDDVAAHLMTRQSAMQQAYEEKIGALRVHLDRLASQNLVDQDGLERRVSEIIARQAQLETRQAMLGNLSDRSAGPLGTASLQEPLPPVVTLPAASNSGVQAERRKPTPAPESFGLRLRGSDDAQSGKRHTSEHDNPKTPLRERVAYLQNSLTALESTQIRALDQLLRTAETKASRLRDAVREVGLNPDALDSSAQKGGMGGPLVPVATGAAAGPFESMVERVQTSVERLEHLGRATVTLPFGRPMPGDVDLTSVFGYRIDPFTRGPALHTGLDFKAEHGAAVRASGPGQVVSAEYTGGYGNMVEIDHGNSVTTRYAHLSAILVSVGQTVTAGAIVGRAGSTGRSTGAHLHYETRIDGEAVDPQRFLRAGSRLAAAL